MTKWLLTSRMFCFNCSSPPESAGFSARGCVSATIMCELWFKGHSFRVATLCWRADYQATPCVPLAGGKRKKQLPASLIGFLGFGEWVQTRRPSGQPASSSRRTTRVIFIPWQHKCGRSACHHHPLSMFVSFIVLIVPLFCLFFSSTCPPVAERNSGHCYFGAGQSQSNWE